MDQVRRFRSSTTALRFEISRQIFDSGVSHSSFTDHSDILRQSSQHHEVPHNVEMVRSQIEIDPKEVIITSDKPLGKGAMGTAYRCMLRGNPYVVKVPNKVELRSSDKGKVRLPSKSKISSEIVQCFRMEISNAETMHEPRSVLDWKIKNFGIREHREAIHRLSGTDVSRYKLEFDNHSKISGYQHIHRVFHLQVLPYPMLFSEPCDGATPDLYGKANFVWKDFARQMLCAFEFTLQIEFVHVDWKPVNILYQLRAGNPWYLLSDFGACYPAKEEVDVDLMARTGTIKFNPTEKMPMLAERLSAVQFANTLLSAHHDMRNDAVTNSQHDPRIMKMDEMPHPSLWALAHPEDKQFLEFRPALSSLKAFLMSASMAHW